MLQNAGWKNVVTEQGLMGNSDSKLDDMHTRQYWKLENLILKQIKIHYNDVIMSAMASQITGVSIVYIRLFRCKSKKTSKLRVTGLCAVNSPITGEFPAQRASYAENVSIWWRHPDIAYRNLSHLKPLLKVILYYAKTNIRLQWM